MSSPDAVIDHFVAKAKGLHSLPAVAMEVLELTRNPQVDTHALKACIENDPALTTKLLRVVNSSLFGLSREVSDLNQALALLGTKPLKLLVLGFSLPPGLFAGIHGEVLQHYWRHTLTKAVAGREISERIWNQPGDDAFIVGLLQDLAELLLIQELGEPYTRLLEKAHADGKDLIALETEAMGFDHTTLTSRLLAHWKLPEALVETVRWNVDPEVVRAMPEARRAGRQILHLAELVARLLADRRADTPDTPDMPDTLGELLAAGREYHDLSRQQLDTLVETLEEKVRQLAEVLSLDLPEGLDYRDILARAHEQLSDVAASTAEEWVRGRAGPAPRTEWDSVVDELRVLQEAVARLARPDTLPEAPAAPVSTLPEHAAQTKAPKVPKKAELAATSAAGRGAASTVTEPDPGLLGRLQASVATCRQAHCPLSLLMVELDHTDELAMTHGVKGVDRLLRRVESACRDMDHARVDCLPHGEFGFAVILPDCERQAAVRLGNQLIASVRSLAADSSAPGDSTVGISVGAASVALPPKNFHAHDLLESATRCLYGSHASGGGVVKSIEIY
jgi:HD-like signal output (HDOD) protein/GGDEF domain-containing protein